MKALLVLCLLVGCAENTGMRPRGKRNSLRIEALENRLKTVEDGGVATPSKRRGGDIEDRLDSLDERLTTLHTRLEALQKELAALRAAPAPTP